MHTQICPGRLDTSLMSHSRSTKSPLRTLALTVVAFAAAAGAHAGDVQYSIGANVAPGVSVGITNAPPVYVQPAPVLVAPQPVYVQRAPVVVVPQPVYVEGAPEVRYVERGRHERHEHEKHEKHEHHDHHDRGDRDD